MVKVQLTRADPLLVDERILAIDFGKAGGFCWNEDGIMYSRPMPETPAKVLAAIKEIEPKKVWGEEVHTMGNEGRNSLETFIRPIGIIEGICLALDIPMFYVRPQTWFEWYGYRSKHFATKLLWKKFLMDEANRLYPSQYATKFTADAILLWNYAVNHLDQQKKLPKLKFK